MIWDLLQVLGYAVLFFVGALVLMAFSSWLLDWAYEYSVDHPWEEEE